MGYYGNESSESAQHCPSQHLVYSAVSNIIGQKIVALLFEGSFWPSGNVTFSLFVVGFFGGQGVPEK